MLDSIKSILNERPFSSLSTSLGGYLLSLTEVLTPFLRFLILAFSTITAFSVAYVHYKRARREWYGEKDSSKKDNSNPR